MASGYNSPSIMETSLGIIHVGKSGIRYPQGLLMVNRGKALETLDELPYQ